MDIHASVARRHLLFYIVILFLVTACGGGGSGGSMSLQDDSNLNSAAVSLSARAISTPPGITEAFCVHIEVSAADMATIISDTNYPAGTQLIETVVPNIPVGEDRTVLVGALVDGPDRSRAAVELLRADLVRIEIPFFEIVTIVHEYEEGPVVVFVGRDEESISTSASEGPCAVQPGETQKGIRVGDEYPAIP